MKKLISAFLMAVLVSGTIAGCSNVRNRDVGLVTGGALGGIAGSAITGGSAAGTIVGAVGGAFVGHQIGRSTERPYYSY
jgi:osmotically inducible lipoprotein OsmB